MRVAYFGRLAEAAGVRAEELALPATIVTVSDLRALLAERVCGIADADRVRALVDDVLVDEAMLLDGVEEVGFLPPVSGG